MGVTSRAYRFDNFMSDAPEGLDEDQVALLEDLFNEKSMGWDLVWNTTKDKIILSGSGRDSYTAENIEDLISPLRRNSWYFIKVRGTVNDDHQIKLVNTETAVSDAGSIVSAEEYTVLDADFIGSDEEDTVSDEKLTTANHESSSGVH